MFVQIAQPHLSAQRTFSLIFFHSFFFAASVISLIFAPYFAPIFLKFIWNLFGICFDEFNWNLFLLIDLAFVFYLIILKLLKTTTSASQ